MIEFISGTLVRKSPSMAVIQTGGFGFQVLISLSSFDALPETGSEVNLHSLLAVREDSLTLFGFVKREEREMFEQLTQVSGIGPKLALTALSGLPLSDLQTAILHGDVKRLCSISGIGRKMAERMVVELKDKLEKSGIPAGQGAAVPAGPSRDAILALVALGYKQQEAAKMLGRVAKAGAEDDESVEELVRRALSGK